MIEQKQAERTRQRDTSKREERAQRILDAAAVLILRWGYNKTTIDDIARQAGVAKGTIYLHWSTREELFTALMQRERQALSADIRQRVAANPTGATLHGMLRHSALALMQRPLIKAVFFRDSEIIGKLSRSQQVESVYTERITAFTTYLEVLREHGLVRSDIDLRAAVYALCAIFWGFFLVAPLMPEQFRLPDEEFADLLAEAIQRTLGAGRVIEPGEQPEIAEATMQYLNRSGAAPAETAAREADEEQAS